MQYKDEKTLFLRQKLGELIRQIRKRQEKLSLNALAYSYEIDKSNLSRIENGLIDCKVISLWRIAEALGMKTSDLVKELETQLGEDFKLIDE